MLSIHTTNIAGTLHKAATTLSPVINEKILHPPKPTHHHHNGMSEATLHAKKPKHKHHHQTVMSEVQHTAALFLAAQNGALERLTHLLDDYAYECLTVHDAYGWTLLMVAACEGHVSVVTELLNRGLDPRLCTPQGQTARSLVTNAKNSRESSLVLKLLTAAENILVKSEANHQITGASEIGSDDGKIIVCDVCNGSFPSKGWRQHLSSTVHNFHSGHEPRDRLVLSARNPGYLMLRNEGWIEGMGLGKNGEGRKNPIATVLKRDRAGVGVKRNGGEKPRITHFAAGDTRAVHGLKKEKLSGVSITQRETASEVRRQRVWEVNMRRYLSED